MPRRVLHVLSQRPLRTGSGITLDAMVRHARESGWRQRVLVGEPVDRVSDSVGGLDSNDLRQVTFRGADDRAADLDFPVVGMSDLMPYRSTRFSSLDDEQLVDYESVWRARLTEEIADFQPDVIHCHHSWMVASLLCSREIRPPVVLHGHGTELRQMELCPHLAERVRGGCRRADRLVVLHDDHARRYAQAIGISASRIHVVGAGYREEVFDAKSATGSRRASIVFAGKLSYSKGLDCLLDAVERLSSDDPSVRLRVAGAGEGAEADALRARMESLLPHVEFLGRLDQRELASVLSESTVFALPSFFEGMPLVLVEALASGCRLVSTDLPGIRAGLASAVGDALEMVECPRMDSVDRPAASEIPAFVDRLAGALRRALSCPPLTTAGELEKRLEPFTWASVFRRVEQVWDQV